MKEFDRLFGEHENWWARLQTAKEKAQALQIIIVLKNQFTFICLPEGKIYINPTGNPVMAQGGMGDVLTGIVTAFIAQGYSSAESAILACYIHGKAGDNLAMGKSVVNASSVAREIPGEIKRLCN
jgi:NAD(P)H-hydrate repair Nnr-like enzyme with NAD(P)H-hydrate dehydratase domain